MTETNTVKTGWNLDNSYATLPEMFYSKVLHTPVASPSLVIVNHALSAALGLNIEALQSGLMLEMFCGNRLPDF